MAKLEDLQPKAAVRGILPDILSDTPSPGASLGTVRSSEPATGELRRER
jgi:hypothetical protein